MTSAHPKRPLSEVLDEIAFDNDLEELDAMSDAELDAELARSGVDMAAVDAAVQRVLDEVLPEPSAAVPASSVTNGARHEAKPAGNVVSLRAPHRKDAPQTRWVPFLAAAGMALAIGFAGASRAAHTFPVATVTYPTQVRPPPPGVLAAAQRRVALRLCAMGYYGECEDWLDAAKALDGGGEDGIEVRNARRDIARAAEAGAANPDNHLYGKAPLGPGERPLQPRH